LNRCGLPPLRLHSRLHRPHRLPQAPRLASPPFTRLRLGLHRPRPLRAPLLPDRPLPPDCPLPPLPHRLLPRRSPEPLLLRAGRCRALVLSESSRWSPHPVPFRLRRLSLRQRTRPLAPRASSRDTSRSRSSCSSNRSCSRSRSNTNTHSCSSCSSCTNKRRPDTAHCQGAAATRIGAMAATVARFRPPRHPRPLQLNLLPSQALR